MKLEFGSYDEPAKVGYANWISGDAWTVFVANDGHAELWLKQANGNWKRSDKPIA